jgi:glycosyltransferase involved in cell wall biosynthesis
MKIGVDARPLETARPTGINNYIYHVLDNIENEDIRLYFKKRPEVKVLENRERISSHIFALPLYRWKVEEFWERNIMPYMSNKQNDDVFWGGRFFVPKGLKCKSVATIHDLAYLKIPRLLSDKGIRYFDKLTTQSVAAATSFITISETTRMDFCELYKVAPEKVDVIHNGYNTAFLKDISNEQILATQKKYSINQPYVLFVGTLEPRKNLKRLVKAYINSEACKQDCSLVLCGDAGWFHKEFLDEIQPFINSKKILITGYVSNEELIHLYKGCMFFAFPSLYEGFGIPILEAMAAGVPVLTSNNSSMKELFSDSTEQIDPYDIDSIINGINNLLNSDLQKDLIKRGNSKLKEFSWKKCAEEHVNHFKNF